MVAQREEAGIGRLVGGAITLAGVVMVGAAAVGIAHASHFHRQAVRTSGRVIANIEQVSDASWSAPTRAPARRTPQRMYCAVVEYSVAAGQPPVQYRDESCSNPPAFTVGQAVAVSFDPRKPTRAVVDHGTRAYWAPLALGILGLLCLLVGAQRLAARRCSTTFL